MEAIGLTTTDDSTLEERIRATSLRYAEQYPWLDPGPIEAYVSLLQTMRVHNVAVERYLHSLGLPRPISGARHTVLRTLYFADMHRLSQIDISQEVGVSRTNMTNLIDALERDGLVVRVINPTDRRTNFVELTAAGMEFCSIFIPAVSRFMASMFGDLSEAEIATFNDFLRRVRYGLARRYFSDDLERPESQEYSAG